MPLLIYIVYYILSVLLGNGSIKINHVPIFEIGSSDIMLCECMTLYYEFLNEYSIFVKFNWEGYLICSIIFMYITLILNFKQIHHMENLRWL